MDIRKTLLWAIFTISALLLFNAWQEQTGQGSLFSKSTAPAKQQAVATDNGTKDLPKPSGTALAAPTQTSAPKSGELLTLKNDVLELEVDTLGGVVSKARLLKHLEEDKSPVLLFDRSNDRKYFARTGLVSGSGAELPNHTQVFTATKNQANNSITLVAEKNGVRLEKTYTLNKGSYVVEAKHTVKNISAQNLDATLYAELVRDGGKPSFKGKVEESSFYSTFTGPAVYTDAEKFHKIDFSDIEKGKSKVPSTQPAGETAWVAMVQHYFVSAWVPPTTYSKDLYVEKLDKNQFRVGVKSKLDAFGVGQEKVETFKLFVGPQEERVLENVAPGLELVKDYGWLTILAKPIFWLLEKIHALVNNWGWAIILLTVFIKLVFFPLSAASYKSMARMKEVQPRLLEMKERYKGEPQKLNQAMMEMYRKEKINPLGGCFPVLIQIPVFIALYWVLLASVEMRAAPWLGWIQDLSKPDTLFGVWFGAPIGLLPILMAISMFVQTKLNPTPPDPVQAKLMMLMPIVFSFMFFFFPAGLVLYWVVNNILSIAQQWQINKIYGGSKAA
ncbi:membrane protein insertase YidC [Polynucleobacter victoriensis]|uniref:Membrane protein insertase YidC n=1 Tax=Polynucleobacter victoriensis TaxID=2049319 RepID=A0A212TC87_9BURK|nr:membrane protein insertase YidC [Polynucleobacter victoriensis]SNC63639.1 YidC/Oxa1 family membrane protein insertase [Polynucleobacter victoriensis]